jgi:hypothetical protein
MAVGIMDAIVSSWATAISRHSGNGREIIWRFAETLNPAFDTRLLPDRIIIVWRYEPKTGLPTAEHHAEMNSFEHLLGPITETEHFAILVLVSTGEGLREWTYYAKSSDEFVDRLNVALRAGPAFPVEIHVASDPTWSMYCEFRTGVSDKVN